MWKCNMVVFIDADDDVAGDGWEEDSNASDDSEDGEWVDVVHSDDEGGATTGYINPETEVRWRGLFPLSFCCSSGK